ncbi:MAG TPA: pilus assembly protein PilO [Thiotrichales bacterium]|nr:pilus assembly protein PilO [Thiotrichales bacterium]
MKLSELNELDINNVGSWPVAARAVLVLAVCLAVAAAIYWFDIRAQEAELARLEQQEQKLKASLRVKAGQASNLKAYLQQLEEMKKMFAQMRRQLPSRTEVPELLVDISQTGVAAGLEFELFRPQAEQQKDFYAEKPVDIVVTGTYHQFGIFVSGVAALPRIVTLHNITIERKGKNKDKLVMTTTAKTYRYLDDDEIERQEAKKRKAKKRRKRR